MISQSCLVCIKPIVTSCTVCFLVFLSLLIYLTNVHFVSIHLFIAWHSCIGAIYCILSYVMPSDLFCCTLYYCYCIYINCMYVTFMSRNAKLIKLLMLMKFYLFSLLYKYVNIISKTLDHYKSFKKLKAKLSCILFMSAIIHNKTTPKHFYKINKKQG